jgi:hypothetical protein
MGGLRNFMPSYFLQSTHHVEGNPVLLHDAGSVPDRVLSERNLRQQPPRNTMSRRPAADTNMRQGVVDGQTGCRRAMQHVWGCACLRGQAPHRLRRLVSALHDVGSIPDRVLLVSALRRQPCKTTSACCHADCAPVATASQYNYSS